jgi:glutamate dehydrogenase (NAD(P)+)
VSLNINNEEYFDEFGPEKVMLIRDPPIDMKGFLVIDNSSYGIPLGGLRMAEDLTLSEIMRLARVMTLKFCTYKVPLGGAKAGLIASPDISKDQKNLLIANFAENIKPLIKGGGFYPEPGLGVFDTDIDKILEFAGRPQLMHGKIGLFSEDIPIEKKWTGIGVTYCIKTIFHEYEKFGKSEWNDPPNIMLEGFGRAGIEIVKFLHKKKYKLTGLSTLKGAIYDEDGLEIQKLLELRKDHGDEIVNKYESSNLIKVPKEELFELSSEYPTDIIIPGARPDIINKKNVEKIQPKAIIPISSAPYQEEILETLNNKGILAMPDFITNAGDILELNIRQREKSDRKILENIENEITKKVINVLENSYQKDKIPYFYAKEKALNDLKKKMKKKKVYNQKLEKIID